MAAAAQHAVRPLPGWELVVERGGTEVAVERLLINLFTHPRENTASVIGIYRAVDAVAEWSGAGVSSRPPHGLPHHQGGLTQANAG